MKIFGGFKLEDVDGEKHVEKEHTFYAEVEDFNWTEDAKTKELHEQWKLVYPGENISGRLRLINNRRFTEAVKEKIPGDIGHYECEFDIPEDAYMMKRKAAVSGYLKERYTFPITGTNKKWEVDVFKDRSGGRSKWVKIDLEVDNLNDDIPELPFSVKCFFRDHPDAITEIKNDVRQLWELEWLQISPKQALSNIK